MASAPSWHSPVYVYPIELVHAVWRRIVCELGIGRSAAANDDFDKLVLLLWCIGVSRHQQMRLAGSAKGFGNLSGTGGIDDPARGARIPQWLLQAAPRVIPVVADEIAFQPRPNLAQKALANVIRFIIDLLYR
jgi:hypothetical protein